MDPIISPWLVYFIGIYGKIQAIPVIGIIISAIVLLTQGTRRIPIQYAKRVIGRKVYGGVNTHFPMRVNTAGVMPIIFAQAIMFVPSTVITFFPESEFMDGVQRLFSYDSWFYWILYGVEQKQVPYLQNDGGDHTFLRQWQCEQVAASLVNR